MPLTRTDENELLTALHEGALAPQPWASFASRLRARAGADVCRLLLRGQEGNDWSDGQRAVRPGANQDANAPLWSELRPDRVYAAQELGLEKAFGRYLKVHAGEVALGIALERHAVDFTARDAALLAALAPHASIALRVFATLHHAVDRARAASHAATMAGLGWILLDQRGRIIATDVFASRLLAAGKSMHRAADGRLRCSDGAADAALNRSLAGSDDEAVWLSSDPPRQMLPVHLNGRTMLVIQPNDDAGMRDPARLTALYGLSAKEAALTFALCDGATLSEAGATLGLTLETVRNYSKRIYAKTGARGQGDLVRLVLGGVAGLLIAEEVAALSI